MARFWPEPPFKHHQAPAIGLLLVNLGTPAAPTAKALRPYLKEFLSDPRVVEIPKAIWWPILHGFILPFRPGKSAKKYAAIWTSEGSPLLVHTQRQAKLVKGRLGQLGVTNLRVDWAMRYGEPSIETQLRALKAAGCTRILVLPLYPQFAASTTASVMDEVARCLTHWRNLPELRYVRSFHDDPGYIAALESRVRQHWMKHGQGDLLVMSFHGTPQHALDRGDPYHCECQTTARLLAQALGLPPEAWKLTFQSRFGKAQWLQPYTQPTLETLARHGLKKVDLICPGFAVDCLETLEEIALECKQAFLAAGGQAFQYIACLNDQPEWIDALSTIARQHLGNWLTQTVPDAPTLEARAARAKALGAQL